MRGYRTKDEVQQMSSVESNSMHKSTKKQSKKTFKVGVFIALVLISGVCAIIGYNRKTFEHYSDYEYADSDSVVADSVAADIVLADSVAKETAIIMMITKKV